MSVLAAGCVLAATTASAQQTAPRFEVAAQTSLLRPSDFGLNTPVGMGGRVSFDVNSWLAVEGEVLHFPSEKIGTRGSVQSIGELSYGSYRRRTDALFGVKLGTRGERFGLFAKARPGFARLSHTRMFCEGPACAVVLPPPGFPSYRTELAFDVGGGLEFYPGARLVARAEIGDTMIRNRSTGPFVTECPAKACTTHNLSSTFGLGYRF